jgi:hypothetical protein
MFHASFSELAICHLANKYAFWNTIFPAMKNLSRKLGKRLKADLR